MKFIILGLAALIAVIAADVSVVHNDIDRSPDSYRFSYELDNGVKHSEAGILRDPDTFAVTGNFYYVAPEGDIVKLLYTADENGFQPVGPHLPTPPPVPERIQRALDYIAAHPTPPSH